MEELFRKYLDNQCSPEEVKILLGYFNHPENESQLRGLIFDSLDTAEAGDEESQWQPTTDRIFARIKTQQQSERGKLVPLFRRSWLRIAATVILVAGIYYLFNYFNTTTTATQPIAETDKVSGDIGPGGNKAILTLANGTTINLTTLISDTIAKQGTANILRVADGHVSYKSVIEKPTNILYNSIATPKGGQYQLTLSDGSIVWLNAASSIHFPVVFTANERVVEVTGEVYFEVAKNKSIPFKVKIGGKAEVEVLGTHFNINAYADEPTINTTLLEGSVKVTDLVQHDSRTIIPGQQAELSANNQIKVNKLADVDQSIAWKNGTFNFSNADLEMALRQVARWYDVDIVFEGAIPKKQFSGEIQRSLNLSQVLKLLERNGVYSHIEGKRIIVAK